jgi:hypothetical protein
MDGDALLSHGSFLLRMILSDLPSPAEAGFVKAGTRFPLFGIMRQPRTRLHF